MVTLKLVVKSCLSYATDPLALGAYHFPSLYPSYPHAPLSSTLPFPSPSSCALSFFSSLYHLCAHNHGDLHCSNNGALVYMYNYNIIVSSISNDRVSSSSAWE